MNTNETNLLLKSIQTTNGLMTYALEREELDMVITLNNALQSRIGILNAINEGNELTYSQRIELEAICDFHEKKEEKKEEEKEDKGALTYQGNNPDIEKDGAELQAVKVKDLKIGDFFILSNKSRTVYVRGHYDKSDKDYTCSDFHDIASEKYLQGNKTVYIGFTF